MFWATSQPAKNALHRQSQASTHSRVGGADDRSSLARRFRGLFLPHQPACYALMQDPGCIYKYIRQVDDTTNAALPVSDEVILQHLAGRQTIATPLLDAAGSGCLAAADLDDDGEAGLWQMLRLARQRGLTAFAIAYPPAAGHHGGHVWLRFDGFAEGRRLRQVVETLAGELDLRVQAYPTKADLRLPLGVHRYSGSRGRLLLQDGTVLDLDAGPEAVLLALETLEQLPANPLSRLPELEPLACAQPVLPLEEAPEGPWAAIYQFNRSTDLLGLLTRYGATVAKLAEDEVILHCPCGHHRHGDARPSLKLERARRPERFGQYVAIGYTPSCVFYTEPGQIYDAFAVYRHFEHLSLREAIRLVEKPESEPNNQESETVSTQSPAADPNAALLELAADDLNLQECGRVVLAALIRRAGGNPSTRPSIERLEQMTGFVRRTIFRGLAQLEGRYIRSEPAGGRNTTIRHFLIPDLPSLGADRSPNESCETPCENQNPMEGGDGVIAAASPAPLGQPSAELGERRSEVLPCAREDFRASHVAVAQAPDTLAIFWQGILAALRPCVSQAQFERAFQGACLLRANVQHGVLIAAGSVEAKSLIEQEFTGPLMRELELQLGAPVRLQIILAAPDRSADSRRSAPRSADRPAWLPENIWADLVPTLRAALAGASFDGQHIHARNAYAEAVLARYHRAAVQRLLAELQQSFDHTPAISSAIDEAEPCSGNSPEKPEPAPDAKPPTPRSVVEQIEQSIAKAERKAAAVSATRPDQAAAIRTQIRRMHRRLASLHDLHPPPAPDAASSPAAKAQAPGVVEH